MQLWLADTPEMIGVTTGKRVAPKRGKSTRKDGDGGHLDKADVETKDSGEEQTQKEGHSLQQGTRTPLTIVFKLTRRRISRQNRSH